MVSASGFSLVFCFFFFNDPAPAEISTLSLHDALPILTWLDLRLAVAGLALEVLAPLTRVVAAVTSRADRKSTRLNSSHMSISYAVFCLKKKKNKIRRHGRRSR